MFLVVVFAASGGVAQLLSGGVVAGERLCDATGLRTFYERRDGRAAWDAATTASLMQAIDLLAEEGLQPGRYHRQALVRLESGIERDVLAWVGDDGHLEFHRDHYERDPTLASALQ